MDKTHEIFTIPEVLEVILDYVDTESRQEAAAVCKDFYKTICHLERNKSLTLNQKVSSELKPSVCAIAETLLPSDPRRRDLSVNAALEPPV